MNRTHVDWLDFRARATDPRVILDRALRPAFGPLGEAAELTPRRGGLLGYVSSADVRLGDMAVGVIAFGGQSQRGFMTCRLTGVGCGWVRDWDALQEGMFRLPEGEARRVDIALDTFKGEVSHESVVGAFDRGAFSRGGRPPKKREIVNSDPREGRTVEIGKRDQAQFLRGYEKGWERAVRLRLADDVDELDGVVLKDWYRLELELKAKTERLPVDLIDRRDQYFAGGYPYLREVLAVEPEIFVQRRERGPQLELEAALAVMRRQWGRTLFTALIAHHGDMTAVWDRIVGIQHNEALLAAGVLLVDHG